MCCAGYMNEHNNEEAEDAHVELIEVREANRKLKREARKLKKEALRGAPTPAARAASDYHGNMVAPAELPPAAPHLPQFRASRLGSPTDLTQRF